MYSVVKFADRPVHTMLVAFPITLYSVTLASYVAFAIGSDPFWFRVGFAMNVAGVAMAVTAGVPGFIDWLMGIPGKCAAKGTGARHLALNLLRQEQTHRGSLATKRFRAALDSDYLVTLLAGLRADRPTPGAGQT